MAIRGEIEVDSTCLSYEVTGSGPPLLLIAGLGWGAWSWYKQVPTFSQNHRVIAINNRGVENWGEELPPFTLLTMVEDCLAVLRHLEVERIHVLGFSMGGYIAQELAACYPQCVDRLILQSTALFGPSSFPVTSEAQEFFSSYGKVPLQEHIERGSRLRFSESFASRCPESVQEFVELYQPHAPPEAGYHAQLRAISTFRNEERVKNIRASTLILTGSEDRVLPPENGRLLAEKIPRSTLQIFEGAGHCINIECADEFNQKVMRFLT